MSVMLSSVGPKLRRIGAWTFFCDVAGQVQSAHNPIVTVAAVAIPRDLVKPVRSRLVARAFAGVPVKWKTGQLGGLSKVVSLVVQFKLHISIAQVHCTDPATWQGYFAQGDAFVEGASRYLPPGQIRRADWMPTVMLKTYLLADAFARLTGWVIGDRRPWGSGPVDVDLHLITDDDFSDRITARTFAERVATAAQNAPSILKDLGVVQVVKSSCLTEQAEPLLLLPDYLAGIYHHAEPRTRLANPVVAPEAARAAVADFQRRHSRLRVQEDEFDGTYPLGWDAAGRPLFPRRRRWHSQPGE